MHYWPAWTYFTKQLNIQDWEKIRILDFGGGRACLLRDPQSTISHQNYWNLEVRESLTKEGKKDFPLANWIYVDRWNAQYNPFAERTVELPLLSEKFDLIIAYSVFTHTTLQEFKQIIINYFLPLLSKCGTIVISFWELERLDYVINKYRKVPSSKINKIKEQALKYKDGFYLVDNSLLLPLTTAVDKIVGHHSLSTFYAPCFLQEIFCVNDNSILKGTEKRQSLLIINASKTQ